MKEYDIRSSAKKIIKFLERSYGSKGKATTVKQAYSPNPSLIKRTRDGKEILEILLNSDGNDPVVCETFNCARNAEYSSGDGTTSSSLAFLYGVITYASISSGEIDQVNEVLDEVIQEYRIKIKEESQEESEERKIKEKRNVYNFIYTAAGKTLSPEECDSIAEIEYKKTLNLDNPPLLRLDEKSNIYDKERNFVIQSSASDAISMAHYAPSYLKGILENISTDNWMIAVNDDVLKREHLESLKASLGELKREGYSENTKVLAIAPALGEDVKSFYHDKEGRLDPYGRGVFAISSINNNVLEEKEYMRALMVLSGINLTSDEYNEVNVLFSAIYSAIVLETNDYDINRMFSGSRLESVVGKEIINTNNILSHIDMKKELSKVTRIAREHRQKMRDCENCDLKNKLNLLLCHNCRNSANDLFFKDLVGKYLVTKAPDRNFFRRLSSVDYIKFSDLSVSISGFPFCDESKLKASIESSKDMFKRAQTQLERYKYSNILNILRKSAVYEIKLSDTLQQSTRVTEVVGAICDVDLAIDKIIRDRNKQGFIEGNHKVTRILANELGKLASNPTAQAVSSILKRIAEHKVEKDYSKEFNGFYPLDSSIVLRNMVKNAIDGIKYAEESSDYILEENTSNLK